MPRALRALLRFSKYLLVGTLSNTTLWAGTFHYLETTPPTYTSEALINVAGGGPGVNVNLPEIGQAVTSSSSSFSSSSSDPRENYKLVAMGPAVLKAAASNINMTTEEFGEPLLSIVNNTTILKVEGTAQEPGVAQQKVKALWNALYQRLDTLRIEEQQERDKSSEKALATAQSKLTAAQQRVSTYKAQSGLNSSDQVKGLIANIDHLRQKRAEMLAVRQQINGHVLQLSTALNLSPQEAADALVLQTDQLFQKSYTDYSESTATLVGLLPERGPNYPDVVEARRQQEAARQALLERGQLLLGRSVDELTLSRLVLDNGNGSGIKRGELFQELVQQQSKLQGAIGEVQALTEEVGLLEQSLQGLTQKESVLEGLLRDLQVAEAIFASTLAKVDLGAGDPYASYPIMQLIEAPNLPVEPSSPKRKLVLLGTVLGSLLTSIGLTLLWYRQPLVAASKTVVRGILE